jgi:hypothetical protein
MIESITTMIGIIIPTMTSEMMRTWAMAALAGVKLPDACKIFKKKFSCGASVVETPDNKEEIEIQVRAVFMTYPHVHICIFCEPEFNTAWEIKTVTEAYSYVCVHIYRVYRKSIIYIM